MMRLPGVQLKRMFRGRCLSGSPDPFANHNWLLIISFRLGHGGVKEAS